MENEDKGKPKLRRTSSKLARVGTVLIFSALMLSGSCGNVKEKTKETINKSDEMVIDSFPDSLPGQTNAEIRNRRFRIKDFLIAPDEQAVYRKLIIEGFHHISDDETVWDGDVYAPCTEIDFKTTSLIFMGGYITFKESFRIPSADISSLRVIHQSISFDFEYTTILSPSENKVYSIYKDRDWTISVSDISNYTHIRQLIFKDKNGKLFFLPIHSKRLHAITIPIDEVSLQHVFSNNDGGGYYSYYADKNGLYHFSGSQEFPKENVQQQLESSNGKPVQAVLHEHCLVYGDAAYPYGWPVKQSRKSLRLNANELNLIITDDGYYLGDKNKLFAVPFDGNGPVFPISPPADLIQKGRPKEPVNEWKFFDIVTVGDNIKKNILLNKKTLYYSSEKINWGR